MESQSTDAMAAGLSALIETFQKYRYREDTTTRSSPNELSTVSEASDSGHALSRYETAFRGVRDELSTDRLVEQAVCATIQNAVFASVCVRQRPVGTPV